MNHPIPIPNPNGGPAYRPTPTGGLVPAVPASADQGSVIVEGHAAPPVDTAPRLSPSGGAGAGPLIFGSVCSGIEAASVAWGPLGWRCAFVSEIEPAPCAVLTHRYPEVPNLGDFIGIEASPEPVDLLVGGTPCQDFSVAGLRAGLAGERGNLTLEFLRLLGCLRPRWLVWENVPGILSIDGGRAFGAFLGGLGQLGYGFAYRVLDAQYFGVPQRRRRVFVVGYLGDWRRAAAVLLEQDGLRGHPAPRREAGVGVADSLEASLGRRCGQPSDGGRSGDLIARALTGAGQRQDGTVDTFVVKGAAIGLPPDSGPQFGEVLADGTCYTLNCTETHAVAFYEGSGTQSPGSISGGSPPLKVGRNTAVAIRTAQTSANGHGIAVAVSHTLDGGNGQAIAFDWQSGGDVRLNVAAERTSALHAGQTPAVATFDERNITSPVNRSRCEPGLPCHSFHSDPPRRVGAGVRRLTPRECERLQGFDDDWTLVPYRGKPMADGPRYRMLGNSMAVPVMRWIGRRIAAVEAATPLFAGEAGQ